MWSLTKFVVWKDKGVQSVSTILLKLVRRVSENEVTWQIVNLSLWSALCLFQWDSVQDYLGKPVEAPVVLNRWRYVLNAQNNCSFRVLFFSITPRTNWMRENPNAIFTSCLNLEVWLFSNYLLGGSTPILLGARILIEWKYVWLPSSRTEDVWALEEYFFKLRNVNYLNVALISF